MTQRPPSHTEASPPCLFAQPLHVSINPHSGSGPGVQEPSTGVNFLRTPDPEPRTPKRATHISAALARPGREVIDGSIKRGELGVIRLGNLNA